MTITPTSAVKRGNEVQQFEASLSSIWTSSTGDLFNDAGCTVPYTGDSRTIVHFKCENWTTNQSVTATAGAEVATATISVTGVFPSIPHYPIEWEGEKLGVVTFTSRTGRQSGRVLGTGNMVLAWRLSFFNRRLVELEQFELFWERHSPHKLFIYEDRLKSVDFNCQFVDGSKPKFRGNSHINFEWESSIRQVE